MLPIKMGIPGLALGGRPIVQRQIFDERNVAENGDLDRRPVDATRPVQLRSGELMGQRDHSAGCDARRFRVPTRTVVTEAVG